MDNKKTDYSAYSLTDLMRARQEIDEDQYPEEYQEIQSLIKANVQGFDDKFRQKSPPEQRLNAKTARASAVGLSVMLIYALYTGHFPGRSGGIYANEDPYWYWALFCFLSISNLYAFYVWIVDSKSSSD
ncbi:hypothetical protein MJ923_20495 [Shewanella sp. 3B26]|uniref:2TM domain-containing protein n=1 Tax=Shewanella zhuhaiensis TaxID=2919576 RepID=A0AAJ1F015_9GAMM|nr:hypothetical protein [Shewanella zhuhaiensis]MCH4296689.1 hypothetical protein [Shewanella zhuhaiensis]